MSTYLFIGQLFTFLSSFIAIILILYFFRKKKSMPSKQLLFIIIYFNSIWFLGMILQFLDSIPFISTNQIIRVSSEILFSSLLFCVRFFFLYSILLLLDQIHLLKFLKQINPTLKITVLIIACLWIIGLLQVVFYFHSGIIDNLMIYSDIVIFISIITSGIYMYHQVDMLSDLQLQSAMKKLSVILIVPMILACLKWIMGNSFNSGEIIEKILLFSVVILFNGAIIWWILAYRKILFNPMIFKIEISDTISALVQKYNISKREMDVILLICEGKTNKEIAEKLFISTDTVKDHNSNIFQKTGVKNRTQIAKLFLK